MAILTAKQAETLNNICNGFKSVLLGDRLKNAETYDLVQLSINITTGSTSNQTVTVPFGVEIIDLIIQCRGTSTNGTMKGSIGSDVTDAIVCATDTAITKAGTIDDSKSTVAAGGTLGIICAGDSVASTKGLATFVCKRT